MTKEEAAQWGWVAGIIDGEGSIGIYRARGGKGHYPTDQLYLRVDMTHSETIERLKVMTKTGAIIRLKPSTSSLGKKPMYRWYARDISAAAVLRRCLPYMCTKREQAEVAINYADLKALSHPGGQHPTPPILRRLRQKAAAKLKSINRGEKAG